MPAKPLTRLEILRAFLLPEYIRYKAVAFSTHLITRLCCRFAGLVWRHGEAIAFFMPKNIVKLSNKPKYETSYSVTRSGSVVQAKSEKTPYQGNYLPYLRKIPYLCICNRVPLVVVGRMHRQHQRRRLRNSRIPRRLYPVGVEANRPRPPPRPPRSQRMVNQQIENKIKFQ